jgi:serine/threonine protein kinase
VPSSNLLCPACQTPLPGLIAGAVSLHCPACQIEVDVARLATLVGKPRFVAERNWTGVELDGMVVEDLLGAGGMGTVYRARSRTGDARFAVKFLSPSLAAEPELVARFWREVALLEKLDHPAIVKVRGHGQSEGIPWFAMELVDGVTLATRLTDGTLSVDEARSTFTRLLGALAHAHARGVIHRDLKPANVLLAADGARLADFGIAHLDLEAATRPTQLTRTNAVLGTFPYMSPEQRAGRPVDARSDLYSVGVMLYEALAGDRPEGAFVPLSRRRPGLSSRIDQVITRLLQPDARARFGSAGEAHQALVRALAPRARARRVSVYLTAIAASGALVLWMHYRPKPADKAPRGGSVAAMQPVLQTRTLVSPDAAPMPLQDDRVGQMAAPTAQQVQAMPPVRATPKTRSKPPPGAKSRWASPKSIAPSGRKSGRAMPMGKSAGSWRELNSGFK